ncbi:MAG: hypothetical protein U9N44_02380 [Chloroflexota bacterium]|nr:hypothetical protein [Chloroflexota bacterium]
MTEDEKERPEIYSDQFMVSGGPYGMVLNFKKAPPEPGPGKVSETVGRVWMSYEHAKMIAFVLSRHIKKIERETGVSFPVPTKVLSEIGIGMEDWELFWKSPPEFRG